MANKYTDILNITANGKNQMGLSNTIKRDYGIPLDFTSVQADFAAAVNYAATSTLAYVGQPISVGDKLYIITAESQGKYPAEVEEGGTQIDVFLAEVGSATEGDGSTIDLKDGVLSLHGIDGKTSGTYVPTLVDGVLTWNAPDNTTVDGLTASVDALNLKVFGKEADEEAGTEKVDGLVDIVEAQGESIAANAKAISDETAARETAISDEATARENAIDAINDIIGDVTEDKTIVEMIADAEAAAKAAIPTDNASLTNGAGYQTASDVSSAISTAISDKADKATTLAGYGITDAYTKEEVNSAIAGITHFTTKVVTSIDEVTTTGILYLIKDETAVGVDKYNEYLFIDGVATLIGDTTTNLSDYYNKTEIDGKVETIESDIDTLENNIGDFDTLTQADGLLSNRDSIVDAVLEIATKAGNASAGLDGISQKLTGIYTTVVDSIEDAVSDALTTVESTYATKQSVTDLSDELENYAKSSDVENELAKKIETAQITHTTNGVPEGVTKDGTTLNIVVDAYTKAEVYTKSEADSKIDEKIASVTGGESAADVKLALESYRDAVNSEIWGPDAANWTTSVDVDGKKVVTYTPKYGTTSRVDTLESDVATLKTNVEKAQTDATNAGTAIETLKTTTVADNTRRIGVIEGQITGENGLSARIGAIESRETAHATEYTNLKAKVDTAVDTTIPALTTRVSNNENAIATITTTLNGAEGSDGLIAIVNKKANTADVYTKNDVDAKIITSGEVVRGTTDSITIADNKITVNINSYTKGEVDTAISTAIGNIDNTAITNNSADIAVLVGSDKGEDGRANKSIRTIAADEINTLIKAADPEGGKTIENINNLIAYVDENAGEIADLVTATAKNTAKLAGIEEGTTVKKYVDDSIAAIPEFVLEIATSENLGGIKSATGNNKVTVGTDGTASVATISTDSLVQGTMTLVLNGGTASIAE